ncbi:ADP-ribosyltransferase exoenzyme [Flavobacterium sp. CF108]|uniref:ADP-ribosyltransferase n=1 Tax=unclassified Flavobacterium TaxID=196869 RepID=UPI0008C61967|nr:MULTISPECIES: ADP-ribosyltransferase [unclassified Flavobacterium]SEO94204.1 ADP-ribosyltransferase exoenzyme [Flavobacterium sp. fv08]SHH82925.1 ADP-ribosyltransferase exoenzyme [Flavobacterium sp. CF108]
MQDLFDSFEKCEDVRHERAIQFNREFFEPERGINYYQVHHEGFIKKLSAHEFGKTTSSGENLDAIIKYDLSQEEASIVYMYTHHHIYENLNHNLRNNFENLDEDFKVYSNRLNSALDKLPSFSEQILYRDIRHPQNGNDACLQYYEQNIGRALMFNDFQSCHTDDKRISDEETDFQFVITTTKNSNAKDIQELTFVNNEKEVLFKNRTQFLIERVDKKENRVYNKEI